ncbi:MAG: hypothetical protein COT73_04585 [Bdellovibrio sp. CG10_big_fil_rev_8_21_14_0_10_47_8]|nr:MAG: hypothetical protein COT73_04585 [Bdellovibrio sp. CG10_big_fil_rev_8_21_14_0_10_47_8]
MALLKNRTQEKTLLTDLHIADRMWSRMKGLLGTSQLGPEQGLWIHRCNSIHTFFMSYAIDCVFVDDQMKVKALVKDVRPGRLVLPIWGAKSVIEVQSGWIEQKMISVGDTLDVGTAST